jgi:ActR/RegA family two-component response regulator
MGGLVDNKILFVDDDLSILQGYNRILHREFQVSTANSGEQGLATIRTAGPFAVVISDMRMPGMNGAQFLAKVREKAPDTVRMLLTGYSDLDAAIEAVNQGNIFRYLTKPCEKEILVKAIKSGLESFHSVIARNELVKKARLVADSAMEWDKQAISQAETFEQAAGLPGPPEARQFLDSIFKGDRQGYVVLIKLSILKVIEDRYGPQPAEEYIRNSIQFLTRSIGSVDRMFHWSRDVLMIVVRRQLSPVAMRIEINRLMQERRDQMTEINGRPVMIAAPTTFDLLPVSRFSTFDEMFTAFDAKLTGSF